MLFKEERKERKRLKGLVRDLKKRRLIKEFMKK